MDEVRDRLLAGQRLRLSDTGPRLPRDLAARFRRDENLLTVGFMRTRGRRQAEHLVDIVARYADERGFCVDWWVFDQSDDVMPALRRHQFAIHETQVFMVHNTPLTPAPGSTCSIAVAAEPEHAWDYERATAAAFDRAPSRERARQRWEEIVLRHNTYFVAYEYGEPVGGAYLSEWEPLPQVLGVGVRQNFRRRGIARSLVRVAIDHTRAAGEEAIYLTVTAGIPAEGLYRHMGFEPVATRRVCRREPSLLSVDSRLSRSVRSEVEV